MSNNNKFSYALTLEQLYKCNSNPKLGLSRINTLLDKAQVWPLSEQKLVQVIGTNGKGSTCAFLESLLLASGQSCAMFTSPHLSCARERMRFNGHWIDEESFVVAAQKILFLNQQNEIDASFFEVMLAIFMCLCQQFKTQTIILEAGLGGRLDATTALKALVVGLSRIALDHQNILGEKLEDIAEEKIRALSFGRTLIMSEQESLVRKKALALKNELGFEFLESSPCQAWPLALQGNHQKHNAGLALALFEALGFALSEKAKKQALKNAQWPGRFEIIEGEPKIVFDGAHNPSGLEVLGQTLKEQFDDRQNFVLVYGSLKGDNAQEKLRMAVKLRKFLKIFLHEPKNHRALSQEKLAQAFLQEGLTKDEFENFSDWTKIKTYARKNNSAILVCGSLYTVGELRARLLALPIDHLAPNF